MMKLLLAVVLVILFASMASAVLGVLADDQLPPARASSLLEN